MNENDIKFKSAAGCFTGVGVGPGDPELLTLKAIRILKESDRLVLPAAEPDKCEAYSIICKADETLAGKDKLCLTFPMIKDPVLLEVQMDINYEQIRDCLEKGEKLSFITIGDPTVYSTFTYMLTRALKDGYRTDIISGIPSFTACAARLGISLGERSEEIHIIPGTYSMTDAEVYKGTRIYMKSGRNMKNLKSHLMAETGIDQSQVYAVTRCSQPYERVYTGLDEIPDELDYMTVVIVKGRDV